jgi:hypothetical protein
MLSSASFDQPRRRPSHARVTRTLLFAGPLKIRDSGLKHLQPARWSRAVLLPALTPSLAPVMLRTGAAAGGGEKSGRRL